VERGFVGDIVANWYFADIVDNAEEILEKHQLDTHACFGTSSSVKRMTGRILPGD